MNWKLLVATAATVLTVGGAAEAQTYAPKTAGMTILDVRITDVAPDGSDAVTTTAGAATGLRAKAKYDVMPTIGVTHFFTDHIAVEAIAGTTKHSIRAKGGATDVKVKDTWVLPPVVTVQYHFAPEAKVSPYLGAGVNYMLFYNGTNKNGFHFKVDDGFGAALQAGLDIATVGRWQLNLDAKKIFFSTDAVDRTAGLKSKVHLDPWVLSAGVGYRF